MPSVGVGGAPSIELILTSDWAVTGGVGAFISTGVSEIFLNPSTLPNLTGILAPAINLSILANIPFNPSDIAPINVTFLVSSLAFFVTVSSLFTVSVNPFLPSIVTFLVSGLALLLTVSSCWTVIVYPLVEIVTALFSGFDLLLTVSVCWTVVLNPSVVNFKGLITGLPFSSSSIVWPNVSAKFSLLNTTDFCAGLPSISDVFSSTSSFSIKNFTSFSFISLASTVSNPSKASTISLTTLTLFSSSNSFKASLTCTISPFANPFSTLTAIFFSSSVSMNLSNSFLTVFTVCSPTTVTPTLFAILGWFNKYSMILW